MIRAADQAIADQKRSMEIRDLRIKQTEDRLKEVQGERDSKDAWYRSPQLHMLLGFVLGVVIVKKVN